ncbi:hypothetical protein GGE45_006456 [Rhizobium aethiopicum]|uniref:Uncharacterized protein n=1 Tax=Rhizobium aethiopicum TaxID=1138170 RepID=A0A7W6Q985_9HYPH|nr:hypothetical protein [Rhizobium aethiopicum]MBB4584072.1 hypothetical protein [Rhizobium aethiopicum]
MFLVMSVDSGRRTGSGVVRRPGQCLIMMWQGWRFKRLISSLAGCARATALMFSTCFKPRSAHADVRGSATSTDHSAFDHATFRTPRPWTFRSRQVSWLTGRSTLPGLPGASCSSDLKSDSCSPLTVAGAAPALPRHDGANAPYSHLSPRPLRIEGTSNTRYSTRIKNHVNRWLAPCVRAGLKSLRSCEKQG